ncbi:xylose isomerase [Betaproteobacteria bacterium]|nr:xylose isomerase [Betaproteobacteria bacterium]
MFIEALVRHEVGCTSLWREKILEYGVRDTARLVADSGISLTGYCCAGFVTSMDKREAGNALDDAKRAFDEAAILGAPSVVIVPGGLDPRDNNLDTTRKRALDNIEKLIPYARSLGIKIALEPLHPMVCPTRNVLATLGLANDWCDALGAEDIVGIVVDTYCVFWDPQIYAEIARAGERICSFHVSDWLLDTKDLRLDRGMVGDGIIDNRRLRCAVERTGYRSYVEVEIFSERNWWRRDPDEVVRIIKDRFQDTV